MRFRILGLMAAGLLVACSSGSHTDQAQAVAKASAQPALSATAAAVNVALGRTTAAGFAPLPDRGNLVAADSSREVHKAGAYTFHPVALSEAHALNAVGPGRELAITAPNGQPIRLKYERHVEHEDGNWTWIGRSSDGRDAVITFGEKAVFGSIPNGDNAPLRLNIAGGKAWLIETDNKLIAASTSVGAKPREPDALLLRTAAGEPITLGRNAAASAPASLLAEANPLVDVLIGYTNGFAARLGGTSQAMTRLNFLVDITNQAYTTSQIPGRIRLVRAQQVTYADNTSNEAALYALTGFTCGDSGCNQSPIPTALQALHTARDTYGADLVSLVRVFNDPENDSCGIAWLNGGGRVAITSGDEIAGMSVVSDSSGQLYPDNGYFCREETFAHELGHNMGSAHDIDTSDGDDNILDGDEYGAYTWSFGHKTDATQGNFYTIMAYGDSGQVSYRLFSNPRINSCGGRACGVTDLVDNARSLTSTMPIVQTFRPTVVAPPVGSAPNLYAIDKQTPSLKTEVRVLTGASKYKTISQSNTTVLGNVTPWRFRIGDYNGDGVKDIYGINKMGASGKTEVHIMNGQGNFTTYLLHKATLLGRTGTDDMWMFDLGDFNGDGKLDLYGFKRQGSNGKTEVHILNGANQFQSFLLQVATVLPSTGTNNAWRFELGDYNGDGKLDIYAIKKSGTASGKTEVNILNGAGNFQSYLLNTQTLMAQTGSDYVWDFKLGDYNLDGKLDIYGIKRTGTTGTELHIMNGNGGFKAYLLNTTSALPPTGNDGTWEFDLN